VGGEGACRRVGGDACARCCPCCAFHAAAVGVCMRENGCGRAIARARAWVRGHLRCRVWRDVRSGRAAAKAAAPSGPRPFALRSGEERGRGARVTCHLGLLGPRRGARSGPHRTRIPHSIRPQHPRPPAPHRHHADLSWVSAKTQAQIEGVFKWIEEHIPRMLVGHRAAMMISFFKITTCGPGDRPATGAVK
jgi:hypothetical protein